MKKMLLAAAAAVTLSFGALAQSTVGAVDTTFRLLGRNDQVTVERYDDPKVQGVSCYLSRAVTGGISGSLGLAEDPSRFSIACRATGPIRITGNINRTQAGEVVFGERTSVLFKELRVTRFFDAERQVLVYLVWSTRLINGSPFNSVTAIAMNGAQP